MEEPFDGTREEEEIEIIPSAPPQEEEIQEKEDSFAGIIKKFLVRKLTSPTMTSNKTEINNSSSILSPIPEQEMDTTTDAHRILWTQFQVVEWNEMITKLYLIYCFANGLDIYDISNPKQQFKVSHHSSNSIPSVQHHPQHLFSPIFSLRTPFTIKIAKFVSPFRSQFSSFDDSQYPIVAIVCPDQNKIASTLIRFYSLSQKDFISQTISMNHHEIYSLEINSQRGILIVGTRDQIFVYNNLLEKVVQFSCATNIHNHGYGCMALSDRWLAYPSINPIPNETYDFASQSQSLKDVSVNVAKKAASGLLYLGDVSRRVVQNVLTTTTTATENASTTTPSSLHSSTTSTTPISTTTTETTTNSTDGIVEMRDMVTRQILVQFRAHYEPISMIQFDSSGTLLATASIEGTYVNIFQILPLKNSSKITSKSIVHVYKLYRGVTSAYIQNIQFSVNSRWVAVSSAHGTTHLFSIPKLSSHSQQQYPIVCSAMQRIHNNFSTLLHGGGSDEQNNIKAIFHAPIAASFYASKKLSEKLLISTSNGQLLYYNMEPILDSSVNTNCTDVKIDLLGRFATGQEEEEKQFDIAGIEQAEELIQKSALRESEDDRLARWISNVETETYVKPSNPLWMTGQFKFKTFSKNNEQEDFEEEEEDEDDKKKKGKKTVIIETTPIPSEDLMQSLIIKSTDPIPISKKKVVEEFESSIVDNADISRAMESKIGSYGSDQQGVDEFFKDNSPPQQNNYTPPLIISEKDYKSAIQEKHFFISNPIGQISIAASAASNNSTPISIASPKKIANVGFKVNEDYLSEEEEQIHTTPNIKLPNLLDASKINELIQKKEKMQNISVAKSPVIIAAPSFMSDDFKKSMSQQLNGPIQLNENFLDSTFPIQHMPPPAPHQQLLLEEEEEENDLISFGSENDD